MSARSMKILGVLLVAQLIVAALILRPDAGYQPGGTDGKLMSFDASSISRIEIRGQDDKRVVLTQKESDWQIEDYFGSRADTQKVTTLLNDLLDLKASWPVATTAESAKRFEVSADNFQREIALYAGDEMTERLYLGTSPGLRKVHARVEGSDDILAVDFAAFNAPDQPGDWLDKTILAIPGDSLSSVSGTDWTLIREDGSWQLDGLEDGQITQQQQADQLVSRLTGLSIQEVLGVEAMPDWKLDESGQTIRMALSDGTERHYVIVKPEDSYAVLKSSSDDRYFKVAAYQVNEILSATRQSLAEAAPEAEPGVEASTGEASDATTEAASNPED